MWKNRLEMEEMTLSEIDVSLPGSNKNVEIYIKVYNWTAVYIQHTMTPEEAACETDRFHQRIMKWRKSADLKFPLMSLHLN